jgi:hypothetical protein
MSDSLIITNIPDVEEILIEHIDNYLVNQVRFSELFPKSGHARVSAEHPLALLMDKMVNDTQIDTALFPSVTVVSANDSRNPTNVIQVPPPQQIKMYDAFFENVVSKGRDQYIGSYEVVKAAREQIAESAEGYIWGKMYQSYRRASIAIEIWAETLTEKSKLYDLVTSYLSGDGRFSLKANYDIIIDESSVAGERSGIYNFDFGRMLHGAIVRCTADFSICAFEVESVVIAQSVEVVINEET